MNYYTLFIGRISLEAPENRCILLRIGDMALGESPATTGQLRNIPTIIRFSLAALLLAASQWLVAAPAAAAPHTREYVESEQRPRYTGLLREFGQGKQLPPGYELQTLLALSHYPELRDVEIRFIVDDVSIPLSSRPHWASMLRSAPNRTYLVVIDDTTEGNREALLLKNQPFNAQVGIIGHELAHTAYYLDRSFFGILADAACQLSDCRINFERETDKRLITYGLGWQRYDHATFVRMRLRSPSEEASTMEGGGGAYMSPAEILSLIEQDKAYAD